MLKIARKRISRSSATFLLDTIAGLIAAAVVIPKAIAYPTVAGLLVEVGLFTACLPVHISAPVLTSFKSGVGLVITLDQAPRFLDFTLKKENFSWMFYGVSNSVLRCVVSLSALHNPDSYSDPMV